MRAIIRFKIDMTNCKSFITKNIPKYFIMQDSSINDEIINEILEEVSKEDLDIVRRGILQVIYLNDFRVKGIISEITHCSFEVRIKSDSPRSIKNGSEAIIKWIRSMQEEIKNKLVLNEEVEVFEPKSTVHAFIGYVLPKNLLYKSIKENNLQSFTLIICLALFSVSTFLSYPGYIEKFIDNIEFAHWMEGAMARFSTAMLVSAILALLPILNRWAELKKEGLIEWNH